MSDRPIIFSAPMVVALLAGRKSQTRRVLKPQPYPFVTDSRSYWNASGCVGGRICISDADLLRLHRWKVGDRLWVREAVCAQDDAETWDRCVQYLADGAMVKIADHADNDSDAFGRWWLLNGYRSDDPDVTGGKKVPPIHMPRWSSRLTLVVTKVRVERLQNISEADAIAEGAMRHVPCKSAVAGTTVASDSWYFDQNLNGRLYEGRTARDAYEILWGKINGWTSWDANPWVAAISFETHRANIDTLSTDPTVSHPQARGGE